MAAGAGKIAAIVCSIVGPTIAIVLWLSLTFSHREEKHIVTCGVIQHIAVSDLAGSTSPAQHRSDQGTQDPSMHQATLPSKSPFKLHLDWNSLSQATYLNGTAAVLNSQQVVSDAQQTAASQHGHRSFVDGQQGLADGQGSFANGQDLSFHPHQTAQAHPTAVSRSGFRHTPSQMQAVKLIPASLHMSTAASHSTQQVQLQWLALRTLLDSFAV